MKRKGPTMAEHPQMEAFRHAAALMRGERYWRRSDPEEEEFLRALMEVLTEACYHLDSCHLLSANGLNAYRDAVGALSLGGMAGVSSGLVLLTAVDEAVCRLVALGTPARNTGDRKSAPT